MRSPCVVHYLMFFAAAAVGGCGSNSKMAAVSGSVTYRGQPLANAQVNFAPVAGGPIATGQTDASGKFQLGTMSINDGALVGKHKVSVVARGPNRPLRPGEVGSGVPGDTALAIRSFLSSSSIRSLLAWNARSYAEPTIFSLSWSDRSGPQRSRDSRRCNSCPATWARRDRHWRACGAEDLPSAWSDDK